MCSQHSNNFDQLYTINHHNNSNTPPLTSINNLLIIIYAPQIYPPEFQLVSPHEMCIRFGVMDNQHSKLAKHDNITNHSLLTPKNISSNNIIVCTQHTQALYNLKHTPQHTYHTVFPRNLHYSRTFPRPNAINQLNLPWEISPAYFISRSNSCIPTRTLKVPCGSLSEFCKLHTKPISALDHTFQTNQNTQKLLVIYKHPPIGNFITYLKQHHSFNIIMVRNATASSPSSAPASNLISSRYIPLSLNYFLITLFPFDTWLALDGRVVIPKTGSLQCNLNFYQFDTDSLISAYIYGCPCLNSHFKWLIQLHMQTFMNALAVMPQFTWLASAPCYTWCLQPPRGHRIYSFTADMPIMTTLAVATLAKPLTPCGSVNSKPHCTSAVLRRRTGASKTPTQQRKVYTDHITQQPYHRTKQTDQWSTTAGLDKTWLHSTRAEYAHHAINRLTGTTACHTLTWITPIKRTVRIVLQLSLHTHTLKILLAHNSAAMTASNSQTIRAPDQCITQHSAPSSVGTYATANPVGHTISTMVVTFIHKHTLRHSTRTHPSHNSAIMHTSSTDTHAAMAITHQLGSLTVTQQYTDNTELIEGSTRLSPDQKGMCRNTSPSHCTTWISLPHAEAVHYVTHTSLRIP